MVPPDGSGPTPHLAVAAGKDGNMFLVNRGAKPGSGGASKASRGAPTGSGNVLRSMTPRGIRRCRSFHLVSAALKSQSGAAVVVRIDSATPAMLAAVLAAAQAVIAIENTRRPYSRCTDRCEWAR